MSTDVRQPQRSWPAPLIVSGVLGAAAALIVPFMKHQLGPHVSFLPAVIALVSVLDLISAYLLQQQFRAEGDPRSLAMAGAYTWSFVVMLGYALAFPGVVSPTPPFASDASVAPWLFVIWHTGFPVLLSLGWVVRPRWLITPGLARNRPRFVWMTQLASATFAATIVAIIVTTGQGLPVLIHGHDTSRMTSLTAPVSLPLVALATIAVTWKLRRHTGPERWVSTAAWTSLFDLLLMYFSHNRYSVGWYAGRTLTVVAAAAVLLALLRTMSQLRVTLRETLARERLVEQLQRTILDNLGVAVILTNLSGKAEMVNQAALSLFPHLRSGERPAQWPMLTADGAPVANEDRPSALTARTGVGIRDRVIVVHETPESEPMWLTVNTTPVLDVDGTTTAVLASYSDVRERERALTDLERVAGELEVARDEALAATKAKSAFLATMSHEIRTPMNAVIGMTELLLGTSLNSQQRELSEMVRDSGDSLLLIINDILDFSKIEAGLLELDSQAFELRDCIEGALTNVTFMAGEKGLRLSAELDHTCPDLVVGDVTRFRQVIVNLLSNAVKFTSKGEVALTVSAVALDGPQEGSLQLQVEVSDTGIGIRESGLGRLFHQFSQVDSSTTRKYGGTGLGLVISRRLAEAMGGELRVQSVEGEGSTFTFTSVVTGVINRRRTAPDLVDRSVLVISDHERSRRVTRGLLEGWGVSCTDVATADLGLQALRGQLPFDAALIDLDDSAVDLFVQSLNQIPHGSELPLILFSNLGANLTAEHRSVFTDTVTRPPKSRALYDKLLALFADAGPTAADSGSRHRRNGESSAPATSLRVLLAEDNAINRRVGELILAQLGHQVATACDGEHALLELRKAHYDIVLMDIQMPGIDGLETTRRIRAELPADQQPHIVALTASALAGDRGACLAAGMDDYLTKPLREAELRAAFAGVTTRGGASAEATHPPHPQAVHVAVFDALVAQLGEAQPELREQLLTSYLIQSGPHIAELVAAAERADPPTVGRLAHQMRSSSELLGALELAELLGLAEQSARSGNGNDLIPVARRIQHEYGRVEADMELLRA